jgi:hypothetical protein
LNPASILSAQRTRPGPVDGAACDDHSAPPTVPPGSRPHHCRSGDQSAGRCGCVTGSRRRIICSPLVDAIQRPRHPFQNVG